jgi:glycine/D-amino acid oxidase-like deaminating enzyme
MKAKPMQTQANIVIIGGGIAGASIAYHLAQLGQKDVVVLEQGPLVSGTTSHAPGLVGQLRTSPTLARMLLYSVSLYRSLRLDGQPGYLGEGSLRLASSPARWRQIQVLADLAQKIGMDAQLLTTAEAGQRFPLMDATGVEGALFLPGDGSAIATTIAGALIRDAQARGVVFHPHTRVQAIEVANGRVQAVQTSQGRIATEKLVIAAGIWSPRVGRLAGVSIPLTPMQHQYVITQPLPELQSRVVPNLRDPDHLFYLRQREQSIVIGGYERTPKPFDVDAIPDRPDPTVLTYDAAQFETILEGTYRRVPSLRGVAFAKTVCGLESFTPDGEFLLGPAPEVHGVWSACGFCAHGVSGAGGVGKVMAEWIVHGDAGMDLQSMALSRFGGQPMDKATIQRMACKIYSTYYDLAPAH